MQGVRIFIVVVCVAVALAQSIISGTHATGWIVAATIAVSWVVERYNLSGGKR